MVNRLLEWIVDKIRSNLLNYEIDDNLINIIFIMINMHREVKRLIEILLYKFLVYIPSLLILTYIFFNDYLRDIYFVLMFTLISIITSYFYSWILDHYKTNPNIATYCSIIWFTLIVVGFILSGIDNEFRKDSHENNKIQNNKNHDDKNHDDKNHDDKNQK